MRALALISGGLDSLLAARLVKGQGIEVIGLKFRIPFYARKTKDFAHLDIEVKEIDIKEGFLEILKGPRYGFGSKINPCIDCKILMFSKAKEILRQLEAKFVVSGEVLGQRQMSQHRQALELIEKRAGLSGLIVRPLSARLLAETIPEKAGWINRQNLLGFSGRSRRPQIELAQKLGLKNYAQPAGGCLLTDPAFANRLKDLIAHEELNLNNVELLKIGRQFRISPHAKLVVGRNEAENNGLLKITEEGDHLFMPHQIAGPTALGRGVFNEDLIKLASSIVCRYSDRNGNPSADILVKQGQSPVRGAAPVLLKASPLAEDKLISLRI